MIAFLIKAYSKTNIDFKKVDSPFKESVEIMDIIKEELMDPSRDCKKFDPGGCHSEFSKIYLHF